MQTVKVLARLHICTVSPEPLLFACMLGTLFACYNSNYPFINLIALYPIDLSLQWMLLLKGLFFCLTTADLCQALTIGEGSQVLLVDGKMIYLDRLVSLPVILVLLETSEKFLEGHNTYQNSICIYQKRHFFLLTAFWDDIFKINFFYTDTSETNTMT